MIENPRQVTILLVEDDDVDAMAVERALRRSSLSNILVRARDGLEAIQLLRANQVDSPYIVLLDLNMPRMDGLEFLAVLREDPLLCKTIVFVLTTSEEDQDKTIAYEHNVAGYIVKEKAGEHFLELTSSLAPYLSLSEPPPVMGE